VIGVRRDTAAISLMRPVRSDQPGEVVEGVATSRHRNDGFTLRAFANAVNLSD
jgi:hypothetical protein